MVGVSRRWIFWLFSVVVLFVVGCQLFGGDGVYEPVEIVPGREEILERPLSQSTQWGQSELELLRSLWIGSLPPVPPSPLNENADEEETAVLGHHLFFEPRMSANNQISCASCHRPQMYFSDNVPLSFGTRTTTRNAPTLVGAAYAPFLLWDGHKDSLWSQALEPLEHPDEHGSTRLHVVQLMREDRYRPLYEAAFGPLPSVIEDESRFPFFGGPVDYGEYRINWEQMTPADQAVATEIFVNVAKALEAYQRLLLPGVAPFDRYVEALLQGDEAAAEAQLGPETIAGLRLFIGEAGCVGCHNGPLFSDFDFHNTAVPLSDSGIADEGRLGGIMLLMDDPFSCLTQPLDGQSGICHNVDPQIDPYAFRTPTLRYVAGTGPYMHQGQFETLVEVMHHYNEPSPAPVGDSELEPLNLTDEQLYEIETFLRSLSASPATPDALLEPPTQ